MKKYRDYIKAIPILGPMARRLYATVKGTRHADPARWLPQFFPHENGVVVQIGSNDGKTGDPLYNWLLNKESWTGVFVEPVPYLFERLKEAYSSRPRFRFENSVINDGSVVPFYWVSEDAKNHLPELPAWHDQLGGFKREHITNHIPALDPFIKHQMIKGITLMELFSKHCINKLDLLHIDTEGADFQILKQLDLNRIVPSVILYERKHLRVDEEEASIRFLKEHYVMFNLGADILAVRRDIQAINQVEGAQLSAFRIT